MPPAPQGRHARTGPNAPARGRHAAPAPAPARSARSNASNAPAAGRAGQQRAAARHAEWERRQQTQARRGQLRTVRRAAGIPGRGAELGRRGIARGGQHALMAEFLVFCGLVAMRAIADYVPGNQGQADEGTAKGSITGLTLQQQQQTESKGKPAGQLGPLPVLGAGFVVFFVLSFMAARGGTAARIAAGAGLIIDLALLLKSMPELATVSQAYAAGTGATSSAAASSAVPPTPAGTVNPATDPGIYTAVPNATGDFPVITPDVPPVAQGAGQNPAAFTQP